MGKDIERYAAWIIEAIDTLGLVSRDYAESLAELLPACRVEGPHAVATRYRKTGDQLTREEKRSMGLRPNAFMSRIAFAGLTEKGRLRPIEAYEHTIGRAIFTEFRWQALESAKRNGFEEVRFAGTFKDCRACRRLGGATTKAHVASAFAPPDCDREACALMLRPYKDFIGEFVREYQARNRRG